MKGMLEDKLKKTLPLSHPIWTWLVEWSAISINRYHIGKDRLTAQQRHSGRRCEKPIALFGEKVLYKVLDSKHSAEKHETRWEEGAWLRVIPRTNEDLIGTEDGVVKPSAVKRLSDNSKWDYNMLMNIKGYPWQPIPTVAGDHVPIMVKPDKTAVTRFKDPG